MSSTPRRRSTVRGGKYRVYLQQRTTTYGSPTLKVGFSENGRMEGGRLLSIECKTRAEALEVEKRLKNQLARWVSTGRAVPSERYPTEEVLFERELQLELEHLLMQEVDAGKRIDSFAAIEESYPTPRGRALLLYGANCAGTTTLIRACLGRRREERLNVNWYPTVPAYADRPWMLTARGRPRQPYGTSALYGERLTSGLIVLDLDHCGSQRNHAFLVRHALAEGNVLADTNAMKTHFGVNPYYDALEERLLVVVMPDLTLDEYAERYLQRSPERGAEWALKCARDVSMYRQNLDYPRALAWPTAVRLESRTVSAQVTEVRELARDWFASG